MFTLSIILYSTFSCISFTFHGVTLTEVLTLADTIGSYGISEPRTDNGQVDRVFVVSLNVEI